MVHKSDKDHPGDSISLRLTNGLPVAEIPDDECEPPYEGDSPPTCFHGDNTANLPCHGFRISPDPPQDWIFLKLRTCEDPTVCFFASLDYRLDPK